MTKFINLRTYSDYSLGKGVVKLKDLVKHCAKNKIPAVGLTDTNNLFASLEFSMEAVKSGVQPIIGMDTTVRHNSFMGNVLLFASNQAGYQNLLQIASDIYLKREAHELQIKSETLLSQSEGLIVLTGGNDSIERKLFEANRLEELKEYVVGLQSTLKDNLFVELTRSAKTNSEYENFIIDLAYELNIPIAATNEVDFLTPDMHEAQDAFLCIASGRYLLEDDRPKACQDNYLKSEAQMSELFADLPEAIENTVLIAKKCAVFSQYRNPVLPKFGQGLDEDNELENQALAGLKNRLNKEELPEEYAARLKFELSVIHKMKYSGYFLIVSDFIKWSKSQDIPVGPGRGSGAGSVVAWALEITDLDPLEFGLLFERFLNPDRVSMPDFDIDFCQERREEVIRYVQQKYGYDQVAQIVTYGKLQARAVLRDVGRVLHMPYPVIDKICKMVPNNPANPVTLGEAIKLDRELQRTAEGDPELKKLLEISLKLEGLNRHISTHAAGIVISDRPIVEIVPLYKDESSDMPAVQYSMKYAESAGLVKFDFLGLKTLTVISWACKLIKNKIDVSKLPLDDKLTYEMLSRGETIGVFQFESPGMRESIKKLRPDSIQDLIALGSLYRPGPMDNIPSYINRKHGTEKPEYLHPKMELSLKETYGIIVYQEQVMEIARELGGYTLGGADLLRRAMGKKIKAEMEAQRDLFVNGCIGNGIDKALADEIFALIEKFASYGFNKSHAAAYAMISYQTAYLKTHYPVEFLVASINLEIADTDKINLFLSEAKRLGIVILPPDINYSYGLFTIEKGAIRYGLGALKNVGLKAAGLIANERDVTGKFTSLYDFFERCPENAINKRLIESFAKSGSFDAVYENRQEIFENAELFTRYTTNYKQEKNSKQYGLFDDEIFAMSKPAIKQLMDWSQMEKLAAEMDAFGFYLSAHPLEYYQAKLAKLRITDSVKVDMLASAKGTKLTIVGVITSRKIRSTPKGKYAFMQLSDLKGLIEVSIFNEKLLIANDELIKVGNTVMLRIDARKDDTGLRAVVDSITPIEEATANIDTKWLLVINDTKHIETIREHFAPQGKLVEVSLKLEGKALVTFKSEQPMYLAANAEEHLRKVAGIELIEV
ncbi:MAG: DNA polymerase III subunit alpha [Rickettsiales bacterium]